MHYRWNIRKNKEPLYSCNTKIKNPCIHATQNIWELMQYILIENFAIIITFPLNGAWDCWNYDYNTMEQGEGMIWSIVKKQIFYAEK